ncbi:hypothetical protein AB0N64_12245 [Microbacterium sp. NPDC089318]
MVDETDDTKTADLPATVKVTGPGVSIERGVDERTMNAVIGLLVGAPAFPPGGGYQGGGGSGGSRGGQDGSSGGGGSEWDGRMTLGEFLDDSGAKTFPQKICATGFYLTDIKGAKDFNRDEIKSALLAAREDMPGNYSRDWASATSMSLIAPEGHDANRFYIPRTGKKAIESNFQDAPKPRRARKSTKKASSNGDTE